MQKFCNDMETTPVGVIVGLFQAISQKLPAFNEWDSRKHHNLLNSNPAVCDAMTEVRDHVTRYGTLPFHPSIRALPWLTCMKIHTSEDEPTARLIGKTLTACRTNSSRNLSSEQTKLLFATSSTLFPFLFCDGTRITLLR